MLHKSFALRWLRGFAIASALACSRETMAGPSVMPGCEQTAHPDALALAKSDAVGAMQDIGNVTVVELSGDYARNLDAPRQQIAAKFLATHADMYDFVVVFTTFEFETGNSTAFYTGIRNDITGIGQPTFDLSSAYGSDGRLQGYIDMAALTRYSFSPTSPTYHDAIDTLARAASCSNCAIGPRRCRGRSIGSRHDVRPCGLEQRCTSRLWASVPGRARVRRAILPNPSWWSRTMNKGEFVLGIPVCAVGSDQVMTLGGTPDNWTCTWNENGKVHTERFDPGTLVKADAATRK